MAKALSYNKINVRPAFLSAKNAIMVRYVTSATKGILQNKINASVLAIFLASNACLDSPLNV